VDALLGKTGQISGVAMMQGMPGRDLLHRLFDFSRKPFIPGDSRDIGLRVFEISQIGWNECREIGEVGRGGLLKNGNSRIASHVPQPTMNGDATHDLARYAYRAASGI
jgi:hypothetical protein